MTAQSRLKFKQHFNEFRKPIIYSKKRSSSTQIKYYLRHPSHENYTKLLSHYYHIFRNYYQRMIRKIFKISRSFHIMEYMCIEPHDRGHLWDVWETQAFRIENWSVSWTIDPIETIKTRLGAEEWVVSVTLAKCISCLIEVIFSLFSCEYFGPIHDFVSFLYLLIFGKSSKYI